MAGAQGGGESLASWGGKVGGADLLWSMKGLMDQTKWLEFLLYSEGSWGGGGRVQAGSGESPVSDKGVTVPRGCREAS